MMCLPSLQAQTVLKKAGEVIVLTACGAQGDVLNFYRKTGVTTTAAKIGSITKILNRMECTEFRYIMPSGVTREYRFFVVPIQAGEFLEETNGVKVKRIK